MNLSTEKKIMDMENRHMVAKGGRVGGTGNWGEEMQTIAFGMDKQWDPVAQH